MCASLSTDEIINFSFKICLGPLISIPYLIGRNQPQLLIPSAQTINQEKDTESRNEIQLPTY